MRPPKITAITCTGDRPEAFELCKRYVHRQTYQPIEWLVLCDGFEKTQDDGSDIMGVFHDPAWRGQRSLVDKIAFAFNTPFLISDDTDAVAFIEDDDYYSDDYLAVQVERMMQGNDLVGEGSALYYNVRYRWWADNQNRNHASLCQTVVHRNVFPIIADLCKDGCPFLDVRLWRDTKTAKRVFQPDKHRTTVGIKGMPGRVGYGVGHKPKPHRGCSVDPHFQVLPQLIGEEEAAPYAKYYAP